MIEVDPQDKIIWRRDLRSLLGVSDETMRRWLIAGKLPTPDIHVTQRSMGWKVSTLRAAGINLV